MKKKSNNGNNDSGNKKSTNKKFNKIIKRKNVKVQEKSKTIMKVPRNKVLRPLKDEDIIDDAFKVNEDDPIFHFKGVLSLEEVDQLREIENWSRTEYNYEYMGRSFVETPDIQISERTIPKPSIDILPYLYPTPRAGTYSDLTSPLNIKKYTKDHLVSRIPAVNGYSDADNIGLTPLQNEILSVIGRYSDLYYTEAKLEHLEEIRFAYCLHILNHLSKCRSEIAHNNEMLKDHPLKFFANHHPYRDHSFTRPKILILVCFKNAAYKIIKTMIAMLFEKEKAGNVKHIARFEEEYGPLEKTNRHRVARPDDYYEIFDGDFQENFRIGLKFAKGNLKLYSELYHSDIIISSPLAAKLAIGSRKDKNFEVDFLSSIEIVLLDQADVLLMQSWKMVLDVLNQLNRRVKKIESITNVMRTREWNARGIGTHYIQTIILSSFLDPYQRNVYMKARNYAGRVEVIRQIYEGSISQISVKSELNLWLCADNDPKGKRNFFIKNILPELSKMKQVLLYVPDYTDYFLLVYHLRLQGGVEFSTLHEYMINEPPGNISEARSSFYEGRRSMIIMTERFHFYRRYVIKGVQNVMFYGLPSYPHFVPEICNWMADEYQNPYIEKQTENPLITVLFDEASLSNMCYFIGNSRTSKLWETKKIFSTQSIHAKK